MGAPKIEFKLVGYSYKDDEAPSTIEDAKVGYFIPPTEFLEGYGLYELRKKIKWIDKTITPFVRNIMSFYAKVISVDLRKKDRLFRGARSPELYLKSYKTLNDAFAIILEVAQKARRIFYNEWILFRDFYEGKSVEKLAATKLDHLMRTFIGEDRSRWSEADMKSVKKEALKRARDEIIYKFKELLGNENKQYKRLIDAKNRIEEIFRNVTSKELAGIEILKAPKGWERVCHPCFLNIFTYVIGLRMLWNAVFSIFTNIGKEVKDVLKMYKYRPKGKVKFMKRLVPKKVRTAWREYREYRPIGVPGEWGVIGDWLARRRAKKRGTAERREAAGIKRTELFKISEREINMANFWLKKVFTFVGLYK